MLGQLFRSNGYQLDQSELVVIVTRIWSMPRRWRSSAPTDVFQAPSDAELFLQGREFGGAGYDPSNSADRLSRRAAAGSSAHTGTSSDEHPPHHPGRWPGAGRLQHARQRRDPSSAKPCATTWPRTSSIRTRRDMELPLGRGPARADDPALPSRRGGTPPLPVTTTLGIEITQ